MALRAALVLAAAAAAAAAASSAPPSPPAIVIDAGNVTNAAINRRVLGMHCDPGYNQQASAFRASMLYSAGFVSAGVLAPVTAFPDPFTAAGPAARSPAYFSTYNFMDYSRASAFTVGTNAPFNNAPTAQLAVAGPAGQPGDALGAAVTERGMGNEGLYFEAGKPYEGRVILRALTTTTVLIGLRDYVSGVMLANVTAKVVFGGSGPPPYDSIPNRTFTTLAFNLTPAVGTACDIIPPGSDPAIDCTNRGGKQAPSDAHVCVRCGGEFVIGILGGGSVYLAYAELMPGPWGRAAGPNGPLPALKSGADLLTRMGTTMVRQGGTVSQGIAWKQWRGPPEFRPSFLQTWGYAVPAGWGPFEMVDLCNALSIDPVITLAYDSNSILDWADLVEYAWGDSQTTTWGRQRAFDGHIAPYNVTTFELGNEQYNPNFVDQVAAMEARRAAISAPPLYYLFPYNSGLTPSDAQRLLSLGLPSERVVWDLHVGFGGAMQQSADAMAHPPVPGFNLSTINCETNAETHDMNRALAEAADMIVWMAALPELATRVLGRAASFVAGRSGHFDGYDQALAFFLPDRTWLQPPGHVHAMIASTWADRAVRVLVDGQPGESGPLPVGAALSADGRSLVIRAVNAGNLSTTASVQLLGATLRSGADGISSVLAAPALHADNTPTAPDAVAPVAGTVPVPAAGSPVILSLPPWSFTVVTFPIM